MSLFADSSAIVKLYVDEDGHEAVRALSGLAVAQVTRVEVDGTALASTTPVATPSFTRTSFTSTDVRISAPASMAAAAMACAVVPRKAIGAM